MLKELLLGIGIGGIIFTKKGKDIVNEHINMLKDYTIKSISDTDIIKVGKEFLNGYNGTDKSDEKSKADTESKTSRNPETDQEIESSEQKQQENFKRNPNNIKKY